MKSVSKNSKTNRKRAEKLIFNGSEIEPVAVKARFTGAGDFMGAMFSETKKVVKDESGRMMHWSEVCDIIKHKASNIS